MLLALLCQTCLDVRPPDALTPYFEGRVSAEKITADRPCPTGTDLTERSKWSATCVNPARPDDELVVTFDEHDGHLIGYATSIEGYAHGVHRSWYPNGVARERAGWVAGKRDGHHLIHGIDGKPVLDETFDGGVRTGSYATYRGVQLRDHGFYRNGLKEGHWEEYDAEGKLVSGDYIAGKRTGEWEVRALGVSSQPATYFVGFTGDRATRAEALTDSYGTLVGVVDLAWLALALYGHHRHDRRIEAAGAIGLVGSAPLIHLAAQPSTTRRKVVVDSLQTRPLMVAGVFLLYSAGKFFAGLDCKSGTDEDGNYSECHSTELNYNWNYNWKAFALWSAAGVIGMDVMRAVRRKPVPTERAWQLSPLTVPKGGGVSMSGAF